MDRPRVSDVSCMYVGGQFSYIKHSCAELSCIHTVDIYVPTLDNTGIEMAKQSICKWPMAKEQ